jgi:hypothetical protein
MCRANYKLVDLSLKQIQTCAFYLSVQEVGFRKFSFIFEVELGI